MTLSANGSTLSPPQARRRHFNGEFILHIALIAALLMALVLAAVMAVISAYNCHPDEKVHFEAVKFYSANNWLPPAIGDPRTLDSYSAFGKSRLNLPDLYYLIAGKFTALLSLVTRNPLLSARLFNVFLLAILVFMAIRSAASHKLLYGILLVTPQIWYTFSYVNSDAFALFLTMIITGQLVQSNSLFHQYLGSPSWRSQFYKSLPLIIAVTLLYFAKQNFYLYFIFLLLWGLWSLYAAKDRKRLLLKYAVMILVFLVLVLIKQGVDYSIYGPDKDEALKEIQELTAAEEYKPSVRYTGKGHPHLNLKEQGVHYLDLFKEPYNWHLGTFFTFAGAYDYMKIFSPAGYYKLMLLLYIVLGLATAVVTWKEGHAARYFLICIFLLIIFNFYLAFNVSWESDFQPQGRYLFPSLSIIAFLFGQYGSALGKKLFFSLTLLAMAFLSAYSFIASGLLHIPKG